MTEPNLPVPLPGTHLAEVDCNVCGEVIYSVPEFADRAMCTACARDFHGAPG